MSGTGEAKAKPTVLEIEVWVTGSGALVNDTLTKYRETHRRALDAIEALNIPRLTVQEDRFAIQTAGPPNPMAAMMGGNANAVPAGNFTAQKRVTLVLAGIDAMAEDALADVMGKLLDAAKDSGLELGPAGAMNIVQIQLEAAQRKSTTTFRLADPEPTREKALKAALDDARQKAERIARLAGVKLGSVLSVQEAAVAPVGSEGGNPMAAYLALATGGAGSNGSGVTSSALGDVSVRVALTVSFAIER